MGGDARVGNVNDDDLNDALTVAVRTEIGAALAAGLAPDSPAAAACSTR